MSSSQGNKEGNGLMKVPREYAYWRSTITGMVKPTVPITTYVPAQRQAPSRGLNTVSAWKGIEDILADLIRRFHIDTAKCLEFGVEHGFSTVALSSYFDSVIGVDTFQGDEHTAIYRDTFAETSQRLAPYTNIQLVRNDYRDFIKGDHGSFGLIHVDIVHTFADTYACGLWSVNHAQCVIFHDTESFPQVKRAVSELARVTGRTFYNFEECYGLGILAQAE